MAGALIMCVRLKLTLWLWERVIFYKGLFAPFYESVCGSRIVSFSSVPDFHIKEDWIPASSSERLSSL